MVFGLGSASFANPQYIYPNYEVLRASRGALPSVSPRPVNRDVGMVHEWLTKGTIEQRMARIEARARYTPSIRSPSYAYSNSLASVSLRSTPRMVATRPGFLARGVAALGAGASAVGAAATANPVAATIAAVIVAAVIIGGVVYYVISSQRGKKESMSLVPASVVDKSVNNEAGEGPFFMSRQRNIPFVTPEYLRQNPLYRYL